MKVLFTFGGLPHYYNAILNKLNNVDGLEIHVVVPETNFNTIGKGVYQTQEGIKFRLHSLPEYKTYYGKSFFRNFLKLVKNEKPEIIVTIWPYILGFIFYPYLFLLLKFYGIKLILKEIPFQVPKYNEAKKFYRNGKLVDENLKNQLDGLSYIGYFKYDFLTLIRAVYYKIIDAEVVYIEDAYDILSSYGVRKEKIFLIYNSPDTDELIKIKYEIDMMPPILPDNKQRLIHVGRLVKWKKIDLLINSFAIIKNKYPQAELIIIGDGPEEYNLKQQAYKLLPDDSIKFVGGIYDPRLLGQYISTSSIYVLAGMGGLSINEAMCFGKPVICSVCDGTEKKLVRDNYNGKIFIEDNVNDLAEKIDFLFSNPELIDRMGKNSEKIITEEININTVIKGYLRAFNYVTTDRKQLKKNKLNNEEYPNLYLQKNKSEFRSF